MTINTVRTHVANVRMKLGVSIRMEAAMVALRLGLFQSDRAFCGGALSAGTTHVGRCFAQCCQRARVLAVNRPWVRFRTLDAEILDDDIAVPQGTARA